MRDGSLKLRFSFEGHFGPAEARRATDQLEGIGGGAVVCLDFSHCPHVDPGAMAGLVQAVVAHGGVPRLRGLTRHDLRVLHYLAGSTSTPSGPALDAD
jgi:hypothetical protein